MKEKLNQRIVLTLMKDKGYVTSEELANVLKVNEKTIRRRIKQINQVFIHDIGEIQVKKGSGYQLLIYNKEEFNKYCDYNIAEIELSNPINRRTSIFQYLILNKKSTKGSLLREFYISETTLFKDIDFLNTYTKNVGVMIKYLPKEGFQIIGHEYYIRNTLLRLYFDSGMVGAKRRETQDVKKVIVQMIQKVLLQNQCFIGKNELDVIVNYVVVTCGDLMQGHVLDYSEFLNDVTLADDFMEIAKQIYVEVSKKQNMMIPNSEIIFLSYFLRTVFPLKRVDVSKDVRVYEKALYYIRTINETIRNIGLQFHFDSDEKEIIDYFYGLVLRIKFDILKRDIAYLEIETTYPSSYLLSKLIFNEISKIEHIIVTKEEIAYFSLFLQEKYLKVPIGSKNVLVMLPAQDYLSNLYHDELRHFVKLNLTIKNFSEFIKEYDSNKNNYDLIVAPFQHLIKEKVNHMYFTSEFIARNDYTNIIRILSYKDYHKFVENLKKMKQKDTLYSIEELIASYQPMDRFYYASLVGSFIVLAELDQDETILYRVVLDENLKRLAFVININLSANEILDFIRMASDAIIKYESRGELIKMNKLLEYYIRS